MVRGKINGNIIAKDKIDIKARTELFGDIRCPKLVIEEGVTFVGKSEVNPNKATPWPRRSRARANRSRGNPRPAKHPKPAVRASAT